MTPPQQPPSTTAQTLQFLSNILSQRGPTSVPYTEDVKWLIRQHLVSLSDTFPSLHIKSATFTHNDGRTVNLLQADGTIPMIYLNVTYNIPIIVWLMEFYPRNPPVVYVNPTRDMIIKRPHSFVTPSGMVNVPYLSNWVYPSSNLVDLVSNLGVLFANDPPLYSQRKLAPNPNPNPNLGKFANSNPNLSSIGGSRVNFPNPNPNLSSIGGSRVNFPNPNPNLGKYPNPNSSPNPNPNPNLGSIGGSRVNFPNPNSSPNLMGGRVEDPTEVYKRNAINKLVEMVHGDVGAMRKEREGEMDVLFGLQGELRRREETVNRGLREMIDEKEGLENQLQMVLTNADVLEGWLRENEEKLSGKSGGVDVDEVFEACDALSKQMVEVSASDLAIEDVIYSLDKGVQDGVIPFDLYLKNVRLLSREQFFHRALSAKIRGVQMQARVNSMAARSSHYVM